MTAHLPINPTIEQQAVVDAPLAPLRIAAGAGTGKTTTLALRVADLVIRRGLEPEQVLGITFTNKAAGELSDRIRTLLASHTDTGHEVEVHTYHGFAAQLLREFGPLVGVERRTGIITPVFTRQLLHQILATVPLGTLDVTNRRLVEDLARLSSALGDHLLDPEIIPAEDGGEVAILRRAMFTALRHYQREKARLGVSDYADLVLKAHRLVTEHPEVAAEVRSRYRAVLLDEYQDTNPAQRELLRTLFAGGFPVLAVGDVDQTIYEWRGASPHNFHSFPSHFPASDSHPAPTIHLTENRRSLPAVIAVANSIRRRTGSNEPDLTPLPDRIGGEVAVSWHDSAVAEAEWIARRIEILSAGYAWRDMAVLFRKNKDMVLVHDALRAAGIPVEVANLGGLLGIPEIADLRAWLRLLHDHQDAPALLRVLMGSRYRLGIGDLAALRRAPAGRDGDQISLVEKIFDHLPADSMRPGAAAALARFAAEFHPLLQAAQSLSLVELCRQILDRTGAWDDLAALPSTEQLTARLNLYRFLDLTEDWSPLEGRPSLGAFLAHLQLMEEEDADQLDTARLSGEDAVTLMTVHRAKGLEWDVVFIPTCYKDNFPTKPQAFDDPTRFGYRLPYEWRLDAESLPVLGDDPKKNADALRAHHELGEWRIAYVAATRARQRLFFSGAHWYGQPEPRLRPAVPSDLWLLACEHAVVESAPSPSEPPPRPDMLRFEPAVPAPDPLFPEGWEAALRRAVADPEWIPETARRFGVEADFASARDGYLQMLLDLPDPAPVMTAVAGHTSVTGLVTYSSCPQRFFWTEVERLPRRPSPAARHGVEVHRRIELHHRHQVPLEDVSPDLYDLPGSETSSGGAFSHFLRSRFAQEQPLLVEMPFELYEGEMAVRGRIDAVYPTGGGWEIVDFKSGRAAVDEHTETQLQAYAVAAARGLLGTPPPELKVTFAFLGGGVEEVSYQADAVWLEKAEDRLARLTEAIRLGRFDPTPGPGCGQCDFVRFCPAGRAFLSGEDR